MTYYKFDTQRAAELANENGFIVGARGGGRNHYIITTILPNLLKQWGYTINDFTKEQLKWIAWGIEYDLSVEQIKLYANPAFDKEQMIIIIWGFRGFIEERIPGGLSIEQVSLYANPKFNYSQMMEIKNGFIKGLSIEQVRLYAKPEFSVDQMRAIVAGFETGLTTEQVATYANENYDALKMMEMLEVYRRQ